MPCECLSALWYRRTYRPPGASDASLTSSSVTIPRLLDNVTCRALRSNCPSSGTAARLIRALRPVWAIANDTPFNWLDKSLKRWGYRKGESENFYQIGVTTNARTSWALIGRTVVWLRRAVPTRVVVTDNVRPMFLIPSTPIYG